MAFAERQSGLLRLILLAAACIGPALSERTNIVKLNKFNFGDNVKNGAWFVKFYAPWCTHCQRLAPIWEKLADQAADKEWPVKIATVDCTNSKDVCEKAQVKAFPTLALIRNGVLEGKYQGEATVAQFETWLGSQKVLDASAGAAAAAGAGQKLVSGSDASTSSSGPTATHGQAISAVLSNIFANFPTKSKVVNLYFYGGATLALLVAGLCVVFNIAGGDDDDDHDKDS